MHTPEQTLLFIERAFGTGRISGNRQDISVVCPICLSKKNETYNKKKLVIRISDNLSHCWVCDYKSKNLLHLLKTYRRELVKEYVTTFLNSEELASYADKECQESIGDTVTEPLRLPAGFQMFATMSGRSRYVNGLLSYLEPRLTDMERDLWYWKLGVCPYSTKEFRNRIIFPSFDANGNLNYFTGRHIKGFEPKYRNPDVNREGIVFNELNIDWSKELTLVEGPFDLVKCNDNATCVLGSVLTPDYLLFQKIVENKTPVLLAFDRDATTKSMHLAHTLSEYGVQVRILTIPEKLGSDVGELTKTVFIELAENAKSYSEELGFRSRLSQICD